jgi:peptidyl-prolyl cis-trans isomerase C
MVRRGRPAIIGAAALTLLALAACGRGDGADGPPEPGDTAVARVEGETVWASDVAREAVAQGLIGEGEPLETADPAFRRLLDQVVDQKLLAREAETRGLDDDPVVRRRLAAARDQVLGDALVERAVDGAVTDAEVQRLYAEYNRQERGAETVRLRQITAATEAEAQAIRRELGAGAAFETMALQRSTDAATRVNGGDLGFVDPGLLPAEIGRALTGVAPGGLVGPLRTDAGFAVFKVEARRTEPPKSLQELRPQIARFLSFDQIRKLLEQLRRDAEIDILAGAAEGAPAAEEPAGALRPAQTPAPIPEGTRR